MKDKILNYFPVGADTRQELRWMLGGYIVGLGFACLSFLTRFIHARGELYEWQHREQVLIPGAQMKDFVEVLGPSLWGFWVVIFALAALAAFHYLSHWQPSKSIYIMRRLPDKWELHRRCLTAPVLGVMVSLALAFLALVIFYWIYMYATPEVCLPPDQWAKIWR